MVENRSNPSLTKHPFFWLTLSLGLITLLYFIQAIILVYQFGTVKKDWGWEYELRGGKYYVAKLTNNDSDVGKLQLGDQIVAINDDNRIEQGNILPAMRFKLRSIKPNSSYTITVLRGNSRLHFELFLATKRDFNQLLFIISYLLATSSFLGLGFLIGLLKPQERLTQFLTLTSFFIATVFLKNGLEPTFECIPLYAYKIILFFSSISPLVIPFFYEHCYRFNKELSGKKLWINLKYYFYFLALVLMFISFNKYWLFFWQDEEKALLTLTNFNYSRLVGIYIPIYSLQFFTGICLSFYVVLHAYFHSHEPTLRRRIKWAVYGSIIGITPSIIVYAINSLLLNTKYGYILLTNEFHIAEYSTTLIMIICPITCAYAIIRYRHFDINFVIRRGLQYLLAKSSIYLLLVIQICLIGIIIISNPKLTVAELFSPSSIYIYLLSTTVFSLAFRTKVSLWLDRIFFRQVYNREQLLIDLLNQLKQSDNLSEISALVHKQINEALHPKSIHTIYMGSKQEQQKQLISNYDDIAERDTKLFEILHNIDQSQNYPLSIEIPIDEQTWLEELEIKLIVPIKSRGIELIGLMLLGEKSSEEPYSSSDKKLLEAIANQLAVMHENTLLKESVNKERKIKHEVLNRLEAQNINLVKECPICGSCFDRVNEKCSKDNSDLILSLPVERTIDEKYQLDRLIGKGGMGAVYEATDLRLNRKVAVKIMLGDMFGDKESLRRFEREAKASARLNHPHIISVYDYGQLTTKGAYLVMELLKGVSLRSFLNKQKTLSPMLLANLLNQIMEAIKAAHQAGIIHRDLKPENILITEPEKNRYLVKVLDFGLAKLIEIDSKTSNSLTAPGTVMGTFGYMPLEQLSGEVVDERADIFALGVIVVEALTGNRPFEGRTFAELMLVMMKDDFQLNGDQENLKDLNIALHKSLAKSCNDRYKTVEEMQQVLIPLLQNTTFDSNNIYSSEVATLEKKKAINQVIVEDEAFQNSSMEKNSTLLLNNNKKNN